jgi:hypothetical protein
MHYKPIPARHASILHAPAWGEVKPCPIGHDVLFFYRYQLGSSSKINLICCAMSHSVLQDTSYAYVHYLRCGLLQYHFLNLYHSDKDLDKLVTHYNYISPPLRNPPRSLLESFYYLVYKSHTDTPRVEAFKRPVLSGSLSFY